MPDKKHEAVAKGRSKQFGSSKVKAAVARKAASMDRMHKSMPKKMRKMDKDKDYD